MERASIDLSDVAWCRDSTTVHGGRGRGVLAQVPFVGLSSQCQPASTRAPFFPQRDLSQEWVPHYHKNKCHTITGRDVPSRGDICVLSGTATLANQLADFQQPHLLKAFAALSPCFERNAIHETLTLSQHIATWCDDRQWIQRKPETKSLLFHRPKTDRVVCFVLPRRQIIKSICYRSINTEKFSNKSHQGEDLSWTFDEFLCTAQVSS